MRKIKIFCVTLQIKRVFTLQRHFFFKIIMTEMFKYPTEIQFKTLL